MNRFQAARRLLNLAFALVATCASADVPIESRTLDVDGVRIHYLEAGRGPDVLLFHGYTETSRMWRPLMARLADRFHVVAPDLPAIGESGIPDSGIDMKSAAVRLHALAGALHIVRCSVVGHDIGLMVAYAYAAQWPGEVRRLALMDALLPGISGWEIAYDNPDTWHFRFNGPTPEALVQGRERIYFEHFWNDFAADSAHSLSEADREAYTALYARPGRMAASWKYFSSWPRTAAEFAEMGRTKLTMPLLIIGGEKANGNLLSFQGRIVGSDVTTVILPATGHWLMEERPRETMELLDTFLAKGRE